MYKYILTFLLFILFCLHSINVQSQKIKVVTVSVEDIDNMLVINYDIEKSKVTQQFDISLEITSSSGNKIAVKSLKGDIGKNVAGSLGKKIIWDYNTDGIVLQDKIYIEIFAEPVIDETITTKSVSTGKALFLSTILPGLGISKIEKGKPYWIIGIAAYGTLGFSYIMNKKAHNEYEGYLANTDEKLNDELLADSKSQNKFSKTMAYTAIGIWSVNLVWTAIKAKKIKAIDISNIKNKNFQFYTGYDPWTKTAGFTLKLRF
jgi:hypothetical protein